MIQHYYTKEEVTLIKENYHKTIQFKSQFEKIKVDEKEVIEKFLSGNFKAGSLEDPTLDCFGVPAFKYKFTNTINHKQRKQTMSNIINNLPHIVQDAEVVNTTAPAAPVSNVSTINGDHSSLTYSVKPSSKKPGKAIVSGSWNRGEASYEFKYLTKIENATDEILKAKFEMLAKPLDYISQFNITVEETEESKKGVYSIKFESKEVDTYGQYYEIESVSQEVNIVSFESLNEFFNALNDAAGDYLEMISAIAAKDKGTVRSITIAKGGKNNVEYLSDAEPEIVGNLIKLAGNFTSEQTYVSSVDVKEIDEHIINEDDINDMFSVIYDTSIGNDEEAEDADDEAEEAPEA